MVHQVMAEHAVGVAHSLSMGRRLRIQQDARRFQRSGGNDHNLGVDFAMLARDPVDVVDALGAAAVIDQKVADNRVAHQGEFSGAGRGGQSDRRAVEIRRGEAAALALVAIVAGGAATMRNRQVGDAVGHDAPAKFALDHLSWPAATPQERFMGGRNCPSGNCGRPSRDPLTPI